jgi:hypothetical protein
MKVRGVEAARGCKFGNLSNIGDIIAITVEKKGASGCQQEGVAAFFIERDGLAKLLATDPTFNQECTSSDRFGGR